MGMKGKIARCSRGCVGIITNDEKQMVTYMTMQNGSLSGIAYVGIHLTDSEFAKAGDPWSSRDPQILETSHTLVRAGLALRGL